MSREIIHFRLRAKVDKSDLFAFGFSDYGEATKADFVVMWTDYNGIHMFQVSRMGGGSIIVPVQPGENLTFFQGGSNFSRGIEF